MRKTTDEIRVADSRKYFHLLFRGIKRQIFISRIWSPLSKLFLSPPSPDFPSFLFLLLRGTQDRGNFISYSIRARFTYCIRVYIYIIYSVSWRFVSIIVTLRNTRRKNKNLWIMHILSYSGNKFGFESNVKDIVLCKICIYIYINLNFSINNS